MSKHICNLSVEETNELLISPLKLRVYCVSSNAYAQAERKTDERGDEDKIIHRSYRELNSGLTVFSQDFHWLPCHVFWWKGYVGVMITGKLEPRQE